MKNKKTLLHLVPAEALDHVKDRDLKECEGCEAAYPYGHHFDCYFGYNNYDKGTFYYICRSCNEGKLKFYQLIKEGIVKISDYPKTFKGYLKWMKDNGRPIPKCTWRKPTRGKRFIDNVEE